MIELYNYLNYFHIELTQDSGAEIARKKDALFTHNGIILGRNRYSHETMVFHNHKDTNGPSVVTLSEFENGNPFYYTKRKSDSRDVVLLRSFKQLETNKNYALVTYNCQDATKLSREGRTGSHAVANTLGTVAVVGLLALILGGGED